MSEHETKYGKLYRRRVDGEESCKECEEKCKCSPDKEKKYWRHEHALGVGPSKPLTP